MVIWMIIAAFFGAMGGVVVSNLILGMVFKPHKSFEVKDYADIRQRVEQESAEVPSNYKYEPPDHPNPPDVSLDPSKR